jgi:hypothetical protein
MEPEQLTSDLSGLTRMAVASHERLAELAGRVTAVREQLKKLLQDAEKNASASESAEP